MIFPSTRQRRCSWRPPLLITAPIRSGHTGIALNELEKTFAGINLSQISSFLIEKHKQRRIAEEAPTGCNRELGTLKTLFNWFIDNGKFEGANPVRKVKKLKESPGRDRFLEHDEEERLLAACSEPLRTILMAGIYAGLRIPSETLNLKWADVDLKRGLLTVRGAFQKRKDRNTSYDFEAPGRPGASEGK